MPTDAPNKLFRTRSTGAAQAELAGPGACAVPRQHSVYAVLALALTIAALLVFGRYTRHLSVNGILVPSQELLDVPVLKLEELILQCTALFQYDSVEKNSNRKGLSFMSTPSYHTDCEDIQMLDYDGKHLNIHYGFIRYIIIYGFFWGGGQSSVYFYVYTTNDLHLSPKEAILSICSSYFFGILLASIMWFLNINRAKNTNKI